MSGIASRGIFDSVELQKIAIKQKKATLQMELDQANQATGPRKTAGIFRDACSTDLLFLIDTTGSMEPYIEAAKKQVRSIVDDIKKTFLQEAQVRISVVSYKDHDDHPHIQFLNFTTSVDAVQSFLETVRADGGDDLPEDVLGGIHQAITADWKLQTRCLVHIGDAPPHGSSNHDLGADRDDYSHEGSEPHGLTYGPLLEKLAQLKINYAFLRITSWTDRMAYNFAGVYGYDNAKLTSVNAFHEQMQGSHHGPSSPNALQEFRPRFEELELGTSYQELRHLVVRTVTASVPRTATRLSSVVAREPTTTKPELTIALSTTKESAARRPSSDIVEPALESSPPQWFTPRWLDVTLEVEGFCPAIALHAADTLGDMMHADENIRLSTTELTIYARSKPFAAGSVRLASYARSAASTSRFVVKLFREQGHSRAHVAEDMRMQALCKAFALEFNGLLRTDPPLDFIVTSCLQVKPSNGTPPSDLSSFAGGSLSLEPFLEGGYVKYNSNAGFVNGDLGDDTFGEMAQAFSHFTFERSWGRFLVSDLQGVGRTLTDPSVQTRDQDRFKLNNTNLGEEGFKFFFATHKCNSFCDQLELQSNGRMLIARQFRFREHWPMMEPTVCCSNKLCRKIIRLTNAQSSESFPGHNWCDTCWPQLEDYVSSCYCRAGDHEFEVSRFFHESQGELVPEQCPEHRTKSPMSAAEVGGSLYSSLKASQSRSSISGRGW
ncbi:hypothetical protein LTR56_009149 [Elasticomyces elasticus]|nr:hypothetical protein LTR56_009149 [Elasticomyces elasticus]KAK3660613.1 hypothetical protein LTR22_007860 [Elasticomyces elasticus]KAK4915584.1 hypothetical protein LTR49_016307 [Elasticomyces elasticus]KAK5755050.1 hypothetical protein LTS12_014850 [Elasticomyces elasticus]